MEKRTRKKQLRKKRELKKQKRKKAAINKTPVPVVESIAPQEKGKPRFFVLNFLKRKLSPVGITSTEVSKLGEEVGKVKVLELPIKEPVIPPIKSYYQQGREYALAGEFARAIEEYSKALELRPVWSEIDKIRYDLMLALERRFDEEKKPADHERFIDLQVEGININFEELLYQALRAKQNVIDFESD